MRPPGCKTKVVLWAVVSALLSVGDGGHPSRCEMWRADIVHSEAVAKASRSFKGLWVSDKCEIQPGPRFVLRRYHIYRSGHFTLLRFHYLDPWCTAASFSVSAAGRFVPPPDRATSAAASWVVPGGIELDYVLRKVTLVPFTPDSAERLSRRANGSCPGAGWKPSKKYKLLSYDRKGARKGKVRPDISVCTEALGIRFHELQLMRLEHRIPLNFLSLRSSHPPEDRRYHTYLFLGAEGFPTGSRPTYYQTPLVPSQAVQCPTCLAVAKASLTSPPILSSGPYNTDAADLNGQWISLRCEVRPYGLFLRRTFTFGDAWQAQHSYYRDPHCKHPMFVLSATGLYFRGMPSTVVPDAIEYDFHVQEVFLTPQDLQFVSNLNGLYSCGSNWKVGERGNLTRHGGCRELGIAVPSMEQDLVRFERSGADLMFLYLGETTEDKKRPTSFQPPLVRCARPESKMAEDYFHNYNQLRPLPLVSGTSAVHHSVLCFFVVCFLSKLLVY